MRLSALLSLGLAALAQAAPAAVQATGAFPKATGTQFTIDGKTGYFAGSNSYWIGFLTNTKDVDTTLDHFSQSGLKILRIWGFNDVTTKPSAGNVYFQYLSASGSQINTGADGLQRLDYVVRAAEKRGIKLIINFVNNWSDYGGIPAYVTAFGGSATTWFTNTQAQAQYRKYIAAVVSRYSNSSAIFAWELANEPRCNGCSTDVIYKWATDTSAYIRSLDRSHMITLGDEGFGLPGASTYPYGTSEGVDFVKNLGIKDLDFGVFHFYPSGWGVTVDSGASWAKDHAAACKKAGKPCLFEEYGYTSDHCASEKPWQQASLALVKDGLSADLFWQWGDNLSNGQTANDGYTIYYGSTEGTCLISDHVAAIKAAGY